MSKQPNDGVSRRNFLRFAGLTAVAAAATGGGAALLREERPALVARELRRILKKAEETTDFTD